MLLGLLLVWLGVEGIYLLADNVSPSALLAYCPPSHTLTHRSDNGCAPMLDEKNEHKLCRLFASLQRSNTAKLDIEYQREEASTEVRP